ncbi:alpha-2-macroglobulin family protein [Croceimicrobium sp.]|uniref:alpha-2-macroglobulin family protein n=1 Tax=Croceimicrobium sp. TaxID=2828340 RepID=UPI003BAB56F9
MTFRHLSLLLLSLFILSCNNQPEIPENDPAFADYILAHTSGVISAYSEIEMHLAQDLNPGVEPGTPIEAKIFDFSPDIKGQTVWESSSEIRFIPEEPLEPGQHYSAEFELGSLATVESKLKTFEFAFQAIEQSYVLLQFHIEPYETKNPALNVLKGEINTADLSHAEELSEALKFEGIESSSIHWNPGSDEHRWLFSIDSIERKEKAYEVPILHQGKEMGSLKVPSLSDFEVIGVYVQQLPVQKISISFSDPLSEKQSTNGMFQVDGEDVASLEIEGSVVHLYPKSRKTGTVQLKIYPGLKNILGYKFPKEYISQVSFQARKPEIRFVNSGTIIPTKGSVNIPFQAVSLRAVDLKVYQIYANKVHQFLQINKLSGKRELRRVARPIHRERIELDGDGLNLQEWNNFAIDLDRIIERQPGAIYRIEIDYQKAYSLYPCEGDDNSELQSLEPENWDEPEEVFEEDYYEYYYFRGYDYKERDNPCHISYYNRSRKIERNVLASDIGLVVKGTDKEWYAYAQRISSTSSLNGVKIKYYNYQGQLIKEGVTDGDGYLRMDLDTRPFLVVAESGSERAYLSLENSSSLSVSSFAVGGRDVSTGIEGMIYTERGIWRPGDTLFLDFILNDAKSPIPASHPIVLTLKDPRGQEVYRTVQSRKTAQIFSFPITTSKEAITGNYSAQIKVGGKSFYKSLPIETIQPNRLDITLSAPEEIIDGSKKGETEIKLEAEWLTGASASDLQAEVRASISGNPRAFADKHPLFDFYDESRSVPSMSGNEIFNDKLDATGKANINADLGYLKNSPGMLRLNMGTKVFEPGGRFSINSTSLELAPFKNFVGIQMPETNKYGYLETEKDHPVGLIRVNQKGEPISGKVKVSVYKVSWSWWWSAQRGNATYLNNSSNNRIASEEVNLVNGRGRYSLNIPDDHWGRLYIVVEDPESGHRSSSLAYVDWGWGRDRSGRAGGESVSVLNVQTDKDNYQVGETAKISVPSAAGGRLILSYENATGQIIQKVLATNAGSTVHELKITPEMAPNCYAHAMILQPHSSKGNDLPLRLYGIIPIMVEDPATHLHPQIEAPEKIRPNSDYNIKVSEKNGKAMEYTLAIVDEGLLGLNNFQSPDPWPYFYSKIALGLRTWDLYDEVIGGFSGEIAKMLAIGGDGALLESNEEDADRFVPVVRHLGPFKLKAGEKANHKLQMPNYIGNVRVMVVAANDKEAYGAADTNIRVKQPLMVQMTVPRVLGPEEELLVPVTVFAMEEGIKDVNLELSSTGKIELIERSKKISFSKTGQQTVYFKAKVKRALGKGSLKITAQSGVEKSFEETEIAVRSPLRRQKQFHDAILEDSNPVSYKAEPFGIAGSNKLTVEVSSLPKMNLSERLEYLIGYPHGCLEQTTSKCFAQLNLDKWIKLDSDQKAEIQSNIRAGLSKLRTLQLGEGGFRYWPGQNYANAWASTYVGHFMLSAEKAGYNLPVGMKDSYLRFARKAAREWNNSNHYSYNNDFNQAYRLYVLALAGKPELGAMTRLKNRNDLTQSAAFRLAAAYALVGEKDAARALLKANDYTEAEDRYYYYCYGSSTRRLAMQMETFYAMGDKEEALRLAKEIAEKLSDGWHSTQTIAYTLQAMSQVFGGGTEKMDFELVVNGKTRRISSDLSVFQYEDAAFEKAQDIRVKSLNGQSLYLTVMREGLPVYGSETANSSRIDMTVQYLDQSGNKLDPSALKIGTPIIAKVTLQRLSLSKDYENLAVSQFFPSGWEITNNRVLAGGEETEIHYDYQDIRDDRVLTYYNGYRTAQMTIQIELTATYPGKWYLPPTWAEAMYEGSINANNVGQWVEVLVD